MKKIRTFFDHHVFIYSISLMLFCFTLFLLIIGSCQGFFPARGLRNLQGTPGKLRSLSGAKGDEGWETSATIRLEEGLQLSPGAVLLSPTSVSKKQKFAYLEGISAGDFHVEAYQEGKLIESGDAKAYGEYYGYQFSYARVLLDQIKVTYAGSVSLLVSDVSFMEVY